MVNPPNNNTQKIERLEARISMERKMILKSAAELTGRTLSEFIISSAYEAAIAILKNNQLLHLTGSDNKLFIEALLNPPELSKNLLKAAKYYKKYIKSE